eukprot:3937070-Rhodomonas_salina.5
MFARVSACAGSTFDGVADSKSEYAPTPTAKLPGTRVDRDWQHRTRGQYRTSQMGSSTCQDQWLSSAFLARSVPYRCTLALRKLGRFVLTAARTGTEFRAPPRRRSRAARSTRSSSGAQETALSAQEPNFLVQETTFSRQETTFSVQETTFPRQESTFWTSTRGFVQRVFALLCPHTLAQYRTPRSAGVEPYTSTVPHSERASIIIG